ncbi:hypothetical protein PALB_21410 [Pseudoalteromonas luteoviolacea B = ATCC 29581]|nr:hypothetical protein PALB_21410 [Pseudoalteromonas luteoviolacea B = ATCC 29581]
MFCLNVSKCLLSSRISEQIGYKLTAKKRDVHCFQSAIITLRLKALYRMAKLKGEVFRS